MLRQVKEPADVAALELCLALLGDPLYLIPGMLGSS